jgi:hypothetical protein
MLQLFSLELMRIWVKLLGYQSNHLSDCFYSSFYWVQSQILRICNIRQRIENWVMELEIFILNSFYKMSCLFSFGTCLVIVIIRFDFVFLIEVLYSACCRYFDPCNRIPSWNKRHLHSRHLTCYLVYSSRMYRPSFCKNKLKTLVFSHRKWTFWACFRENWVSKFGHSTEGVVRYSRDIRNQSTLRWG